VVRRSPVIALAVIATVLVVVLSGLVAPRRAAAAGCGPPVGATFVISGRVHACGEALVDGAGHRVRLLSYDVLSMYGGEGDETPECGHWSRPAWGLAEHVREWGMNSVQLFVSWANIEPTRPTHLPSGALQHHWNLPYLTALDKAIARFHDHGIAVVLTLGQSRWSPAFRNVRQPNGAVTTCGVGMPKWLYQKGGSTRAMVWAERHFYDQTDTVQAKFRAIWQMLATRYRTNLGVAAVETLFEAPDIIAQNYLGSPLDPRSIDVASFYERTARTIHAVAPGLLVIYADWQSRTNPVYFAITRKPRVWNVAYSYEFYASTWDSNARDRFARFHERAASWGVPGWIDEFDAFHYGRRFDPTLPVDPTWQRDTLALLRAAKADHIGWSFLGTIDFRLRNVLTLSH
jgi:hypothetical protein